MDHLEQQIQDFWENQTSPEQRREILRQLEASGMEWKDFLQHYYNSVLAGEAPGAFGAEQKRRVWQRLQEQHLTGEAATGTTGKTTIDPGAKEIPLPGTRRSRLAWLPWMAAASVLLIASLTLFHSGKKAVVPVAQAAATQPATPTIIVTTNIDRKERSITLPDHSQVLLATGSTIGYQQPFEAGARKIRLEGRALFDVAKDSARPFTVTANGFATTALGTRFIVDARRPIVAIRLLTGKVVVNATKEAAMPLQKVILLPGQAVLINTITKHFDRISADDKQPNTKPADSRPAKTLSFERTSLAAVFQRLSGYYKTPILYDKAQVQTLSFTGEFNSSDELELALKVICNMNQLSFTKENGRIVISKQQ